MYMYMHVNHMYVIDILKGLALSNVEHLYEI